MQSRFPCGNRKAPAERPACGPCRGKKVRAFRAVGVAGCELGMWRAEGWRGAAMRRIVVCQELCKVWGYIECFERR